MRMLVDAEKYTGVEGTVTAFWWSFKSGLYIQDENRDMKLMLGFGLGF